MFFLIGSIVLTSWLTLSFKVVQRWKIPLYQTIVFNYLVCVITGSVVAGSFPINKENFNAAWFPWACVMGAVFILLFRLIGATTQRIGVAVASVSNKLSLIIPFVFSIYLYNETATWMKIVGIVIALTAVIFTCWPSKGQATIKTESILLRTGLPALLFIGSGFLDTMIKYVEHNYLDEANKNDYLINAFGVAAFIGLFSLLVLALLGRLKFDPRSMLTGLMIGIPNYFSIWCLLRVLEDEAGNSSAIIPINNMGIVLFSTVMAWIMFRERLSMLNWSGILLSLAAIALIAFG